MKILITVLSSVLCLSANAQLTDPTKPQERPPMFSAFTNGYMMYVTVPGSCHNIGAKLNVAGICRSDRMTRNYATSCSADLVIVSPGEGGCPEPVGPQVFEVNLNKQKVAPEAETLHLKYNGQVIQVRLK